MSLHERLTAIENDYSPEWQLYGEVQKSPGYHTKVPDGTWVHKTDPNMQRVDELLRSGNPEYMERAHTILRRLISLQDQNPVSPTYGIWSWLAEEPLDQMSPPDWNWADFLGLKLSKILFDFSPSLPPDLLAESRDCLRHAASSIFRRNVQPGYTNIAIKGAVVTAAAGEMLGEKWLLEYGTRRLQSIVEHFNYHGGFNEYNSPSYINLVFKICDTGLHVLRDEAARAHLTQIHYNSWATVAEHFHPATRQLVGPHSRNYQDFLSPQLLNYIGTRTGLWGEDEDLAANAPKCPPDLVARIRELPHSPLESQHRYNRRENARSTEGTHWFTESASLGSVSHGITWVQSRPLLSYWLGENSTPVALRLRLVHEDKDFSSGFVWNAQSGNRVLTAANFITTGGDHHPHLDKPADGIFPMEDLRLQYVLIGEGVSGRNLGNGKFELSSGDHRAIIHTTPSYFQGREVKWQLTIEADRATIDALLTTSEGFIDVHNLNNTAIVAGLEILAPGQSPTESSPTIHTEGGTFTAQWQHDSELLSINAPTYAIPESETHQFGQIK